MPPPGAQWMCSDAIEHINVELSLKNKIRLMDALEEFFGGELPLHPEIEAVSRPEQLSARPEAALEIVRNARARWQWLFEHLDSPLEQYGKRQTRSAERTIAPTTAPVTRQDFPGVPAA